MSGRFLLGPAFQVAKYEWQTPLFPQPSEFFIEDLGSSNGTWFNKQRIKRRKIEDGDEYFICSEKVKLVFR